MACPGPPVRSRGHALGPPPSGAGLHAGGHARPAPRRPCRSLRFTERDRPSPSVIQRASVSTHHSARIARHATPNTLHPTKKPPGLSAGGLFFGSSPAASAASGTVQGQRASFLSSRCLFSSRRGAWAGGGAAGRAGWATGAACCGTGCGIGLATGAGACTGGWAGITCGMGRGCGCCAGIAGWAGIAGGTDTGACGAGRAVGHSRAGTAGAAGST